MVDIRPGMVVRSGDGRRLGHVESVAADGFRIHGGPFAPFADLIEVREGVVWVAAHRPGLSDRAQEAPRR